MRLEELLESKVNYTRKEGTRRFRVKSDKPLTFDEVKKHPDLLKYAGPHTTIIDVTDEEDVSKAPGENKWNAMARLYGRDDDEIVVANGWKGQEWICLAINVEV
jgi:hypothetical protein